MRLTALLIAALLPATAAADDFERTFSARVAITAEGRVAAVEPQADLPPVVAQAVQSAAEGLAFEPATVAGVPTASRTTVLVRMHFSEGEGGALQARVLSVDKAEPRLPPPRYPMAAMQAQINAKVWLRVPVDAEGRAVADQVVVESIDARYARGRPVSRNALAEPLGEAARAAAANWIVHPEEIDGVPMATEVRVPVTFCFPADSKACASFKAEGAEGTRAPVAPDVRLAQLRPAAHAPES